MLEITFLTVAYLPSNSGESCIKFKRGRGESEKILSPKFMLNTTEMTQTLKSLSLALNAKWAGEFSPIGSPRWRPMRTRAVVMNKRCHTFKRFFCVFIAIENNFLVRSNFLKSP